MYQANIKIIAELKEFITIVTGDRKVLKKFSRSEADFTRSRKLPFGRLVVLVARLCKKTLSVELEKFFGDTGSTESCSVSAFSQQRVKLKAIFFQYWNMVLCGSFYLHSAGAVRRWEGYRVIAADGSTVSLVNNPALSAHFGGQSNQNSSFVLAKTFYHYDTLNELVVLSDIRPYRQGELAMAYDAIEKTQKDMLLIYDRNFSNYKMVALHLWQEQERKFVIRAKETHNMAKAFIKGGQASAIVNMQPTPEAKKGLREAGFIIGKRTVLNVRLVRVELPTSVEVLITNLWEEDGHPAGIFKELYFMRWGVETGISVQKNIMQLESFSGLTVHAVMQDFYATVMTANLHSILIKDAQKTVSDTTGHRKHPMKVNKNKSFGKLKADIVSIFMQNDTKTILEKLHAHFIKEIIPVRKGRSFERVRKNTHQKSKYKTYSNFKPAY